MTEPKSSRRQKQAEATRREILAASRRLFASHGYSATSMSAIAREAATAVQTIYDSVGQKHAILLALVDQHEQEVGVRQFQQQLAKTSDPAEALALYVALTRRFIEWQGDVFVMLMSAAPTEPDVEAAWRTSQEHHRYGAHEVAKVIAATNGLHPGIPVEQAGDTIGLLTWGTTWIQLHRDYGWPLDRCEAWITDSLSKLLLRNDAPQART